VTALSREADLVRTLALERFMPSRTTSWATRGRKSVDKKVAFREGAIEKRDKSLKHVVEVRRMSVLCMHKGRALKLGCCVVLVFRARLYGPHYTSATTLSSPLLASIMHSRYPLGAQEPIPSVCRRRARRMKEGQGERVLLIHL